MKTKNLEKEVYDFFKEEISKAYLISDKAERGNKLSEIRKNALEKFNNEDDCKKDSIEGSMYKLQKDVVRKNILDGKPRDLMEEIMKQLEASRLRLVFYLKHMAVLFLLGGETQAIVVSTLGTDRDGQIIDALDGKYEDKFMLHYNFPPFSVGEVGFVGSPKRRDRSWKIS